VLLATLGREPQPERDENDPGDRVQRAPHERSAEEAGGPVDGERVPRQPDEPHRAEEKTEAEDLRERPSGANCGRRLVKKTAIFGFARFVARPCR
jgi:hypothetical protein